MNPARPRGAQGRRGRVATLEHDTVGGPLGALPPRSDMPVHDSSPLHRRPRLAALALSLGPAARRGDCRRSTPTTRANCTFAFVERQRRGGRRASRPAPTRSSSPRRSRSATGRAACEYVQFHLTGPGVNLDTDLGGGDCRGRAAHGDAPAGRHVHRPGRRPRRRRRGARSPSNTSGSATDADHVTSLVEHRSPRRADAVEGPGRLRDRLPRHARRCRLEGREADADEGGEGRLDAEDRPLHRQGRRRLGQAGFVLQSLRGSPTTVSTVKKTGARTVSLRLTPGQWYFFTPGGTRHPFIVTG